jgi:chromosome partitioning protein
MGLFNRKNLEGRAAEEEIYREPQGTDAEAEVAIRADLPEPASEPRAAEEPAATTDPYGDELRELESKAAPETEPAPPVGAPEEPAGRAEPAPAAEATESEPPAGRLDKDELRRAVTGSEAEPEDEGRVSADELIGPTLKRRHPFAPEPDAPADKKTMKVFAFANQKGGVAKTTTTLNLAVALSESGHRVLCVDLDPQGNLTMSQGIDPDTVEKSLYHVLVERMPIKEIIQHREVDIAVASIDLAGAEIAMSTQIGRERSLQKALAQVADEYDFVCIDTPPSLGLLTINALTAADKVIVPVQCEYLSMRGLVQLQNTLEMIRENLNPEVQIEGILPTMLDTRTIHAKEAVEILEENFGELVFKSRIRKAIKFAEAPVKGSSVLKYDPKSNAAQCYRDLAEEVLEHGSKE